MGVPPESDREAILGFDSLHRVAQSYLGPLWIAADVRQSRGALRLVRRVALPKGLAADARDGLAALGRRASALAHPNVLGVLEVVEQDDALALIYEHAEAEPLRSLQSWANLRGLSFPVGVALRIAADLLQGLSALHALEADAPELCAAGGLSPDSVLISRDGATQLCDPLIASGAARLDAFGFNTAKLAYAAPEQVRPKAPPTAQADLFTCAALLWELLASRRLLAGSRPAIERKLLEHQLPSLKGSLKPPHQVSPELIALVERALSAEPSARPSSALDFARQLGECGHEVAPVSEVAAFIGKLSGPRFDRRTAAIRARSSGALGLDELKPPGEAPSSSHAAPATLREPPSEVDTPRATEVATSPNELPFEQPSVPRPAPSAPNATRPEPPRAELPGGSLDAQPLDAQPLDAQPPDAALGAGAPGSTSWDGPFAPVPIEPPALGLAPPENEARPALWEQMVAPAAALNRQPTIPPLGESAAAPDDSPHPALEVSAPFANMTPTPFRAVTGEPPGSGGEALAPEAEDPAWIAPFDPTATVASVAPFDATAAPVAPFDSTAAATAPGEGPLPFQHLLPKSKPPSQRPSFAPGSQSWFDVQPKPGISVGGGGLERRYKLALGAALVALVAVTGWFAFGGESATPVAAVDEPSDEPGALEVAPESPSPREPAAAVAPASLEAPSEPLDPTPSSRGAGEPPPPADTRALADAADFASPELEDSQLSALFALEKRTEVPPCAEQLGTGKYSGRSMRRSRQQTRAARRELARGDAMAAYALACQAVAHHSKNPAALRTLADIALQLGDTAQAKELVERALSLTRRDKSLLALRGDILAMTGDIAGSRTMWLRTAQRRGSKALRTRRLVAAYQKAGDKSLARSHWADAASYFRRAVILTNGSIAPSLGLSEALLGLNQSRAALVWAERAARASPNDADVQVLFGDALHENGQGEKARAAWQAALDVSPTNRVAARRLEEGKP